MKVRKEASISKDVILQEVLKKVQRCKYFMIKNENQKCIVNTSHIRYIRILEENDKLHDNESEIDSIPERVL